MLWSREISFPCRESNPGRPARSLALHRLSYHCTLYRKLNTLCWPRQLKHINSKNIISYNNKLGHFITAFQFRFPKYCSKTALQSTAVSPVCLDSHQSGSSNAQKDAGLQTSPWSLNGPVFVVTRSMRTSELTFSLSNHLKGRTVFRLLAYIILEFLEF
jgi:hypothetical protein